VFQFETLLETIPDEQELMMQETQTRVTATASGELTVSSGHTKENVPLRDSLCRDIFHGDFTMPFQTWSREAEPLMFVPGIPNQGLESISDLVADKNGVFSFSFVASLSPPALTRFFFGRQEYSRLT
jgi:hypothetical protein